MKLILFFPLFSFLSKFSASVILLLMSNFCLDSWTFDYDYSLWSIELCEVKAITCRTEILYKFWKAKNVNTFFLTLYTRRKFMPLALRLYYWHFWGILVSGMLRGSICWHIFFFEGHGVLLVDLQRESQ